MGKHGFVDMIINFQEISNELANVKELINKFNRTRRNLWKFKDTIEKFNVGKPKFVKQKEKKAYGQDVRREDTGSRLRDKSPPYGKTELDAICLRAFSTDPVRNFCRRWEKNHDIIEDIELDVIEVLENLKIEFPRLQKWNTSNLCLFICKNWKNVDKIQDDNNK